MSISRRGFLGGLAAGAGMLSGSAHAASTNKFPASDDTLGLLHDVTLCVGCRECEAACATVNDLPPVELNYEPTPIDPGPGAKTPESEEVSPEEVKTIFDTMRRTTDTALTVVNRYKDGDENELPVYRKLQCMHCNDPCCVSVCFVNAFTKSPEGPVQYNADVCVGCRYCVMVCPYNALAYEYDEPVTPRVMSCTMCHPRIADGLEPGCSEACPMGAITFGKRNDLIKIARERIRKSPERYIDHIYGEYEYGGTSWLIIAGTPFGELDLLEGAPHKSIPEMGRGFLSLVPLIITICPGLLAGFYSFSQRKDRIGQEEGEAGGPEDPA